MTKINKPSAIRKLLWRYQTHELFRMGKVMLLTVIVILCVAWLFSEKANAESAYHVTVKQLHKVTKLYLKEQRDYFNCLNNNPIGRDKDGNVLFCHSNPIEVNIGGQAS